MPNFHAKIEVHLRPSVLDPAGEATKSAAKKLGILGLTKLRIGKAINIEIQSPNEDEAKKQVEILCDRLLSNPVIENWTYKLCSVDSPSDF